jgi:toxin ParE1/3/4
LNGKPVIPREVALEDTNTAIERYLSENAIQTALGFVDSVQAAYAHLATFPATGSPRYGHELNLPGLRFWKLENYPYLIFYLETDVCVDVWRILHEAMDIPQSLR